MTSKSPPSVPLPAKLHSFLKIPRWEGYKQFFHITVFRYLVLWFALVPLLASLLDGLPRPLPVRLNGVQLALELPFTWQLLWLSSLAFFSALLLYQVRCPAFLRRYNSLGEYKAFMHDPRWLAWEAGDILHEPALREKFVDRLLKKKYLQVLDTGFSWSASPSVEERQTKLYFEWAGQKFALALPILDDHGAVVPDAEVGVFWEIFGRLSGSRYWSRALIYWLLILSALLFLCVLFQHVFFGLCRTWDWFRSLTIGPLCC